MTSIAEITEKREGRFLYCSFFFFNKVISFPVNFPLKLKQRVDGTKELIMFLVVQARKIIFSRLSGNHL